MSVRRLLDRPEGEPEPEPQPAMLGDWLALLEIERSSLIAQVRAIERILVKYGRLSGETLPRRIR